MATDFGQTFQENFDPFKPARFRTALRRAELAATPDPASTEEIEKRRAELQALFQPFFADLMSQAQLSGQVTSGAALARARALGLPSELVDPGAITGGARRGAQTLQNRMELDILDRAINQQNIAANRLFQKQMFERQIQAQEAAAEAAKPSPLERIGQGVRLFSGIPAVQDFFGNAFKASAGRKAAQEAFTPTAQNPFSFNPAGGF